MIEKLELNVAPKPLGASSSSNTCLWWKGADGRVEPKWGPDFSPGSCHSAVLRR